MTTPTIRGRVWRQLADITPLDHDPDNPIHIPAGWNWSVRTVGPTGIWGTLIHGTANTHQAALARACRHIRLDHNLAHDPLAPMAPADSWQPAGLDY